MSSPREQRQEATREKILKAALQLIDRDGLNKFSLRAVARKVKYSPAGLYEYFANKDDIVGTLCETADKKLANYLASVPENLAYRDYLVELGIAYIRFARAETTYFRLLFIMQMSNRSSLEVPATGSAYIILLQSVQRGIENGTFIAQHEQSDEQIAYTLWSMVHGMAMLQTSHLTNFDTDFEIIDREALQNLISGIISNQ